MKQQKLNLARLILSFALVLSLFGAATSFFGPIKSAKASEPVDKTASLWMENRTGWESQDECYYFGISYQDGTNLWLNTIADISGFWNDHGNEYKGKNNGVDIMEYILIDGVSARELVNKNAEDRTYAAENVFPLDMGGIFAPVTVQTTDGSGLMIRVLKAFKETFTFTIKAGFTLPDEHGTVIYTSKDLNYSFDGSKFTKIRDVVDITERLAMEDRAWFYNEDRHHNNAEVYVALLDTGITHANGTKYLNTDESLNDTWYKGNNNIIAANGGLDIMEYILVNGVSARELLNANDGKSNADCGCWLANPAAYPVYVETTSHSGLMIRLSTTEFGTQFVVTIKAGFAVPNNSGDLVKTTKDIQFTYNAGTITKTIIEPEVEKFDITNDLSMEDRAWGAAEGQFYVALLDMSRKNNVHDNNWLLTHADVSGVWTVRDVNYDQRLIAANGGLDILEYILVNGESVKSITTKNMNGQLDKEYKGTGWMERLDCSPVFVESTTGSGLIIKFIEEYTTQNFTITIKAGFEIIDEQNIVIKVTEDIHFVYNAGTITKTIGEPPVVEKEEVDITDRLEMEDRAWYYNADRHHNNAEVYVALLDTGITHANGTKYLNTDESLNSAWYKGNDAIIAANDGLDIMEYILVNGVSARELLNANDGKSNANCGCWLANPAAYPVYVETSSGSGLMIRLSTTEFGTQFTITIKAGFAVTNTNGDLVKTTKDIEFAYNKGTITKTIDPKYYTLSFESSEGSVDSITIKENTSLSVLPEVPAKEGYIAYWTIDGAIVFDSTTYTYGENKTAVALYRQIVDFADRVGMEDRAWGVKEGENFIYVALLDMGRENNVHGNNWLLTTSGVSTVWNVTWDVKYAERAIANNSGVNLLDYILINGESAKSLVEKNIEGTLNDTQYLGNSGGWLENARCCPVFVESTTDSGLIIKLIEDYTTKSFTLTLKSGFRVIDETGDVLVLNNDVHFVYNNGQITKEIRYELSFESSEASVDSIIVVDGATITNLPEVPAKANHFGYWTIDGVKVTANTVFDYKADKTAIAQYVALTDISDRLDMEDRAWAANEYEICVALLDTGINNGTDTSPNYWFNTHADVSSVWNVTWDASYAERVIANNYGMNLLDYILINGVSAKSLVEQNKAGTLNGQQYLGKEGTWMGSSGCCPVFVETTTDSGLIIKVLTEFVGEEFTITIKAGFTITNVHGDLVTVSKDVSFKYVDASIGRISQLSFEAEDAEVDPIAVVHRKPIANLPAVPEKAGYRGYWTIDGAEISNETVYSFAADKTAVAVYVALHTVTFDGVNEVVVDHGALLTKPADPTKEATVQYVYVFDGWYNGETKWDFNVDVVEGDLNLVSRFNESVRSYVVTFDGSNEVTVEYGALVTKPADPTKESTAEFDFAFEAWYNGETAWNFESDVVEGNVNLVSKYTETKRSYTVSFVVVGREDVTIESIVVEYGTVVDITTALDGVDLTGYTYFITVNSEALTSVEVVADVTVDITFTLKVEESKPADGSIPSSCSGGVMGGSMLAVLSMLAVAILRKKSN